MACGSPVSSSIALMRYARSGCIDKNDAKKMIEALQSSLVPDSLPVMQNTELPFKYPPELYAQKVQGNVTLRIHIDARGRCVRSRRRWWRARDMRRSIRLP